ncbi:MAG: hypothetical protein H7138_14530 [Myxococcales bacterium]|nr:hypothetical protein [Myxococcales bacterium]
MQKNDKPTTNPSGTPTATPTDKPVKKKLSLDITDVSEVLERKISP